MKGQWKGIASQEHRFKDECGFELAISDPTGLKLMTQKGKVEDHNFQGSSEETKGNLYSITRTVENKWGQVQGGEGIAGVYTTGLCSVCSDILSGISKAIM